MDWQQIKETIAVWTGLERDALHIYAALLVQVGSALLLRRSLAHWAPWTAVLALAGANELLDIYGDDLVEAWELDAALHDLWNTMLLPSVLLLLSRFAPRLMAAAPRPAPPASTDPPEPPGRSA
ncbi:MAG TPA: hypothetical protein VFR28_03910 [Allosphingosinicella sp.]|jgi:hypothetical protein|nr:hypothetical protein [Allosphingosinicella sp.]